MLGEEEAAKTGEEEVLLAEVDAVLRQDERHSIRSFDVMHGIPQNAAAVECVTDTRGTRTLSTIRKW